MALAFALAFVAPLAPPHGGAALAAGITEARGHALVVHSPSPSDPRYARMRMEFAAIEMVWRDAGVAFVGLAGGAPETMGALPDGLSIAALRRTAPGDGTFGVRLVRSDGRVVHASGGEVHRAVLLGLAMAEDDGTDVAGTVARSATPASAPTARPDRVAPVAATPDIPIPTMRPLAPASQRADARPEVVPTAEAGKAANPVPAVTATLPLAVPAPLPVPPSSATSAKQTLLDWGGEVGVDPPTDVPEIATTEPVDRPYDTGPARAALGAAPRVVGSPIAFDSPPARDADPVQSVPPAASTPDRTPVADPWSLWSAPARKTPAERVVPTNEDAASAPVTVAMLDPLPPALPAETLARVREGVVVARLEAARDNGFEEAAVGPELPLRVRAGLALADGASLTGPDLGLALLVTRSCGAAHPPAPVRESRWRWFGG